MMNTNFLLATLVVFSFLVPASAMSDSDIQILEASVKITLTTGDIGDTIQYCDVSVDKDNDLLVTVLPATGYSNEDTQQNLIKAIGAIGGVYVYAVNEYSDLGNLYITFGNKYKTVGTAHALRSWAEAVDRNVEGDYGTLGFKILGTLKTNS
jgi:hypothetical protein